jgi:hypothetical protein
MKTATAAGYTVRKPDPEKGLSAIERDIRRELLRSERPIATAAKEIAGLRAQLAALEPKT